jgi:hypothetical protein
MDHRVRQSNHDGTINPITRARYPEDEKHK